MIQWDADAWEEYCDWQQVDRSIIKRINQLIKDIGAVVLLTNIEWYMRLKKIQS